MMLFLHTWLFPAMWLSYLGYWSAKSTDVKETERVESGSSRMIRVVLILCAIALLALPRIPLPLLNERFLPLNPFYFWIGAAITAAGLLFSIWARRHLGKNWSQAVTIKEGHELIMSGPYSVVRHPIYTGLLLGFLGSAVACGEWRGLLAVALIFGTLWPKLKLEEKWMHAHFGDSYEAYSRRVAALVPYLF
jgi:protein-S-isoprenylcysteine O-methyltransferase Ste14